MSAGRRRPQHVLVIGGGITGLAAAHALAREPDAPHVTLVEADERLGGKILTTPFAGLAAVDEGPDSLLARVPEALELCREVGLGGELVHPSGAPALVWWQGRMHPLPDGLVLGVPAGVAGLARSRLLSWRGKARATLEPALPRSWAAAQIDADDLGGIVRRRFGAEVLDRLVGPLVGGINAGDPACMSASAVAPQLAEAATRHRSLLLGLRSDAKARTAAAPGGRGAPVFAAPRAGVGALVEHTAAAARALGVEVCTGTPAAPLVPLDGGGWRSGDLDADAVIVAVPAAAAGRLLAGVAPDAAAALREFHAVSVAMVTLAVPEAGVDRPLDGSGYLVPRAAQRTVTACSWGSTKWAHWRVPGQAILRVSVGHAGAAVAVEDGELLAGVLGDLRQQMGLRADPTEVRITRWPAGLPQYPPGHLVRVAEVERRLAADAPGVVLAGAAYRGLGVPSCIRSARAAARTLLGDPPA